MSWIPKLKRILQDIPEPVGQVVAGIPYGLRPGLGRLYRSSRREITSVERMSLPERQNFILERVQRIVRFAAENVPFYRKIYAQAGFTVDSLRRFEDIQDIPVVTKDQLRACDLEERSHICRGRYLENTGGSTGSTLAFYILPACIPHEWAHMHRIWEKLGYKQSHLKLCFGGRNLKQQAVAYDGLRHQYAVNIYRPYAQIAAELRRKLVRKRVRYLHGYPSALYDFACYCETEDRELKDLLAEQLVGAFLGSEYPTPLYRDMIESVFGIDTVSWYGHTERAILAWERDDKYRYAPFPSYGYAEAVLDADSGGHKLVATCYSNFACPFIRYDTGDLINVEAKDKGLLSGFSMAGGREGEFVTDRNGKNIALTGLVFGRHHPVFELARFIQIGQVEQGRATVFITPKRELDAERVAELFDATGVDIDFSFRLLDEPIKSRSGKVILKVRMQENP